MYILLHTVSNMKCTCTKFTYLSYKIYIIDSCWTTLGICISLPSSNRFTNYIIFKKIPANIVNLGLFVKKCAF